MLRSVVAVIVGYLIFGVSVAILFPLTGRDPHAAAPSSFIVGTIIYGVLLAAVGGYVAARLAPRAPASHAAIVGALIALGSAVSLIAAPDESRWSQAAALVLMAPAAWVGGLLRARRS